MTMVTWGAYEKPSKQKLNNKSSTDSKLVGLDDVLTQVMWAQYFLKYQGYEIHDNVIYQDNQSTTKIENNGRQLSINRTRNIKTIY